ncbi:group I intron-associated PD-(D/E)XK endonuclease [Frateuria sp. GZRR35]|uniref:group I intron-associated PD-(D/E)XK endonuclease n=1 Tax=unclassified Frateuria TaxID=2648894 RepID=UPI003EDCAAB0
MGTKSRGAITVLQFAAEAATRGATVCDPIGDDSPYDLVLDVPNVGFKRIQVKTASKTTTGVYNIPCQPRVPCVGSNGKMTSKASPYKNGAVDALVSCVEGTWYIFTTVHLLPATIAINPKSSGKYAGAANSWKDIGL